MPPFVRLVMTEDGLLRAVEVMQAAFADNLFGPSFAKTAIARPDCLDHLCPHHDKRLARSNVGTTLSLA